MFGSRFWLPEVAALCKGRMGSGFGFGLPVNVQLLLPASMAAINCAKHGVTLELSFLFRLFLSVEEKTQEYFAELLLCLE